MSPDINPGLITTTSGSHYFYFYTAVADIYKSYSYGSKQRYYVLCFDYRGETAGDFWKIFFFAINEFKIIE